MTQDPTSHSSLLNATRSRAKFSGHGNALGAAGRREASYNPQNSSFLSTPGQSLAIGVLTESSEPLMIGVEWDNVQASKSQGFFDRLFRKIKGGGGVDLDIGCLYELQNGERGAIQAFGKKFGSFEEPPFISLSGDERTGDADGHDEYILINSKHWDELKRVLVYIYIYNGTPHWKAINPHVIIDVPGEEDLVVTLDVHDDRLALCAVGGLENVRGGVKLTNYTEYFPGHAEMDRAFGFGLDWTDGKKD